MQDRRVLAVGGIFTTNQPSWASSIIDHLFSFDIHPAYRTGMWFILS